MDGGAWWATVHGVAKSQTRLSDFTSLHLVAKSCPTLCDPPDCSLPGFPVLHHLLEFAQVHVRCVGDASEATHLQLPSAPFAVDLSQHWGLLKIFNIFIALFLIFIYSFYFSCVGP